MNDRFSDLSDVYEAMIDWPKRLANEEPFYRDLFAQIAARHVLDPACGTGRHAALFHSWGLEVEGADISPAMIQRARAAFGEPRGLRWAVRGFQEAPAGREPFDAVVCVGNSLALAGAAADTERAIGRMLACLRPGGRLIVHVLNVGQLPDGPCVWQKCQRADLPGRGQILVLKGVHRCGQQGYVELLVAVLPEGNLAQHESVAFAGLEAEQLEAMARRQGAAEVTFYGGYHGEPFDPFRSVDLLMVATRGQAS